MMANAATERTSLLPPPPPLVLASSAVAVTAKRRPRTSHTKNKENYEKDEKEKERIVYHRCFVAGVVGAMLWMMIIMLNGVGWSIPRKNAPRPPFGNTTSRTRSASRSQQQQQQHANVDNEEEASSFVGSGTTFRFVLPSSSWMRQVEQWDTWKQQHATAVGLGSGNDEYPHHHQPQQQHPLQTVWWCPYDPRPDDHCHRMRNSHQSVLRGTSTATTTTTTPPENQLDEPSTTSSRTKNDNTTTTRATVTTTTTTSTTTTTKESFVWGVTQPAWWLPLWQACADAAHAVYRTTRLPPSHVRSKDHTDDSSFAWQQERQWYHETLLRLHVLGQYLDTWWQQASRINYNAAMRVVLPHPDRHGKDDQQQQQQQQQQQLLQQAFDDWWKQASTAQRQWWNDTQAYYRQWLWDHNATRHAVVQGTKLWWNITVTSTLVETRKDAATITTTTTTPDTSWWNAAQVWWHKHACSVAAVGNGCSTAMMTMIMMTEPFSRNRHHRVLEPHQQPQSDLSYSDQPADDGLPPLIYLNHSQAYRYLFPNEVVEEEETNKSMLQQDTFVSMAVSGGWDAQINQAYCGVASSATVLNSLLKKGPYNTTNTGMPSLPVDPIYQPYHYATQINLLSSSENAAVHDCVHNHVVRYNDSFDGIFHAPGGLCLEQVRALLDCHVNGGRISHSSASDPDSLYSVTAVHVDDNMTVDQLRHDLVTAMSTPHTRIVTNVLRSAMGQVGGGGHFSPLAAYNAQLDAFLFLDVAKYKLPPVWVPTVRLHAGMHTRDACGIWKFPSAQDDVSYTFLRPQTMEDYAQALHALHCQPAYRGYVVVQRVGQTTS